MLTKVILTVDEYLHKKKHLPEILHTGLPVQKRHHRKSLLPYIIDEHKDSGKHVCHVEGLALLYYTPALFMQSYIELHGLNNEFQKHTPIYKGAMENYEMVLDAVRVAAGCIQPSAQNYLQQFIPGHELNLDAKTEETIETRLCTTFAGYIGFLFQEKLHIRRLLTLDEIEAVIVRNYDQHIALKTTEKIKQPEETALAHAAGSWHQGDFAF